MKSNKKEFNYVIGRYWQGDSGSIGAYSIFNTDVFYGPMNQAENDLNYVKKQDSDNDWKIFVVKELEKE
jgi:hypothetical protein